MSDNNKAPTLYEWMGGAPALSHLIEVFYARIRTDEQLGPIFANMPASHPALVANFIGEVLGGPASYSEEGGSHAGMIKRHFDRSLNEAQRKHWMALLLECADDVGVPGDPEFRSAFVAYIEWGTRLAVINSQPGATAPPDDSPMPKWGWGEVGGPYQP